MMPLSSAKTVQSMSRNYPNPQYNTMHRSIKNGCINGGAITPGWHPLLTTAQGIPSVYRSTQHTSFLATVGDRIVSPEESQYIQARSLLRLQHERMISATMARDNILTLSGAIRPIGDRVTTLPMTYIRTLEPFPHGREASFSFNMDAPCLPIVLAQPTDAFVLSGHQAFLRQQIELFEATEDDTKAPIRGRIKAVQLGQVGIRCRHCAHVAASRRQKATVYFPAELLGLYQAAQNMSTNHIQCGLCPHMPESMKTQFTDLIPTKNANSCGGRSYWAKSAQQMGLVDTDLGIRVARTLRLAMSEMPVAL